MKKLSTMALIVALLLATHLFQPVSASSLEDCGDTYTVQHLDNLSKIASTCGLSFSEILALNPNITNPTIIFTGQVLRLSGNAPLTYTTNTSYTPYAVTSGRARISVSRIYAAVGDTVTVSISGFPAYSQIDYRVGVKDDDYSVIYDGETNSAGSDSLSISIPGDASAGEYWVVEAVTTGQEDSVAVTSHWIYINSGASTSTSTYTSAAVSLSDYTVDSGDTVTVTVKGFPANVDIDYRVGERGEEYTATYDGQTDEDGTASLTITIPSGANTGEYWIVRVTTTSLIRGTEATASSIYITG